MTLQNIQKPIVTNFIDDLNIFTLASNRIMKQIKEKLATVLDIIDKKLLIFYVELKLTCNCEQKIIKLS